MANKRTEDQFEPTSDDSNAVEPTVDTEVSETEGLTENGAGLPENNFSAPTEEKEDTRPEDIKEEFPEPLTEVDLAKSRGVISMYDPAVQAYREVPIEAAREMVRHAQEVAEQLGVTS